ncbi:sugar O-acetyltransferase [Clostridium intestinale]|uniref:sugar O-acetyltransferase n=1 Tax=Clostridium intestinale TaxID=36845 RepID=UPI0028EBEFB9|nr:sugar O-acetyltransferase [Clostridium intestinale]
MSMRERIKQGKLFLDGCEGLPEDRVLAKKRMKEYNKTGPDELNLRLNLIKEIFGEEKKVWIEPPFYFCYGRNIHLGDGCYINFNCNFVDDGEIYIENKVMFGPAVTIATVNHPINPEIRGFMYTKPVTIEENCWIGANSVICPGVTIGKNSVIGAGSVVTKDIPENSVAAGNPCRVIRIIDDFDRKYYDKNKEITLKEIEQIIDLNKKSN